MRIKSLLHSAQAFLIFQKLDKNIEEIISIADKRLYYAKRADGTGLYSMTKIDTALQFYHALQ